MLTKPRPRAAESVATVKSYCPAGSLAVNFGSATFDSAFDDQVVEQLEVRGTVVRVDGRVAVVPEPVVLDRDRLDEVELHQVLGLQISQFASGGAFELCGRWCVIAGRSGRLASIREE
jgi:hypothetical protein